MSGNATNGGDMNIYPEGFRAVMDIMRKVSLGCYITILVLSIFGNTTIIAIVLRNKNMQTKANVLIVNMAISDLLATIVTIPRMIDVENTGSYHWKVPGTIGEVFCKTNYFVREVSCAVSIFSMVAIAVDRFFAIVIPFVHRPVVLGLKWLVPIIWMTSIGVNAFYLTAFRLKVEQGLLHCMNVLSNNEKKIFDSIRFVLLIALPLLALVLLYTAIVAKMTQRNIPGTNIEAFAKSRRQQNRNIVKLAVIIIVLFIVCWLPYYIGLLLNAYYWRYRPPRPNRMILIFVLNTSFTILTYASFAVNPYICLVFSSNFRRSTRNTFHSKNRSATRGLTRITTSRNRNASRALSLSNLDISLENVQGLSNAQNTSTDITGRDLETSLDNSKGNPPPYSLTPPNPENFDREDVSKNTDNSTFKRRAFSANQLNEKYLKESMDIPASDEPCGISASLDQNYLRNVNGDTNQGFEP